MTYSRSKRAATFFLALVMLFTLMPNLTPTANAYSASTSGTLSDEKIGITVEDSIMLSDVSWTLNGTSISATVTGETGFFGNTSSNNSTLTIKNNYSKAGTLSFHYKVDYFGGTGSFNVAGNASDISGDISVDIAKGGTKTVKITSPKGENNKTSIEITNIKITIPITATFQPADVGGSYTVDGTAITTATSKEKVSDIAYNLVATPESGYRFAGWYNVSTNQYISLKSSESLKVTEDMTIKPLFVEGSPSDPLFQVGSTKNTNTLFADLGNAVGYATNNSQTQITLISDGTIYGSYTIPSGITLLIPYDSTYTAMDVEPGCTDANYTNPSKYMKLTMADGAKLTVEGTLEVGAKHSAKAIGSGEPGGGSVSGGYGQINMLGSSNITVNSGGSLFCWGYITGNGTVNVLSGATVYEYLQIRDFRGGNASLNTLKDDAKGVGFFFCQYYVQNVEVPLTVVSGATEYVYNSLYINSSSSSVKNLVEFIGTGGLFVLESGSLTKTYVPLTDRLEIDVNGNLKLSELKLTLRYKDTGFTSLIAVPVNSSDYVLPITNNIDVKIHSGITTIAYDMNFLPGSSLTVDQGAKLSIASGKRVFFYDRDDWGSNYAFNAEIIPVKYSPTRSNENTRTWAMTPDAKLVVNGRVEVSGNLYVAHGDANIRSEFNGYDGTNGAIYFGNNQSGSSTTAQVAGTSLDTITAFPAVLQNKDGSTTYTNGALSGNTFYYYNGKWVNGKMMTITYKNPKNGATLGTEQVMAEWSTPKYNAKLDTTRDPSFVDDNNRAWTRTGWTTNESGVPSEGENYTANSISITQDANGNFPNTITLYAVWVRDSYNLTVNVGAGGTATANTTLTVPAESTKEQVETLINQTDGQYYICVEGYEFDGITLQDGYASVTNDITVTINFKLKSYDVSVDGTKVGTVKHGGSVSIPKVTYNDTDKTFKVVTGVSGGTYDSTTGNYVIENVTSALNVTTENFTGTLLIVDKEQFVACPKGENLIVLATTKLADGKVYTLDGEAFYWSEQYKAYVMFADEKLEAKDILSRLNTKDGKVTYVYGDNDKFGDVSGNGQVTSLDAGIINDILNGYDSPAITDLMRLRMDVNGTQTGTNQPKVYDWYIGVSTQDIVKILNIAVGNLSA